VYFILQADLYAEIWELVLCIYTFIHPFSTTILFAVAQQTTILSGKEFLDDLVGVLMHFGVGDELICPALIKWGVQKLFLMDVTWEGSQGTSN